MLHRLAAGLAALILLIPAVAHCDEGAVTLRVAVAANFRKTLEQLLPAYHRRSGVSVKITSASTGMLSAQIQRGAPFDVFLAADKARPDALVDAGLAATGSEQCYARGTLTVLGVNALSDLASTDQRIAIANPRFAPYGQAALDVIASFRDSDEQPAHLIYGSNVQQAFQFFESGAAQIAVVAGSIGADDGISVSAGLHSPIEQYGLALARSAVPQAAMDFLSFLVSEQAIERMRSSGYQPCS